MNAALLTLFLACASQNPPTPAAPEPADAPPIAAPAPEAPAEEPAEDPTEEPADEPVEEPADEPPEEPAPPSEPPAIGPKAAGTACLTGAECTSGICEGQGCDEASPGTCAPDRRACTRDLRQYCGCDGETFATSGSCPGRRFAYKGPCTP